jgi:predicted amidohydrolase
VFAVQHRQTLAAAATYASIGADLECELNAVDALRSQAEPNIVVFDELNGLIDATEGSRGSLARSGSSQATLVDQLTGQPGTAAIGSVAGAYAAPIAYYNAQFGPPASPAAAVARLFTAVTDTMVRAVVENGSRLAKAHHDYLVIGAPLPIREGSACTGADAGRPACPGWQSSSNPADIAALEDPDLAPASSVYVATTADIDNVSLVFAPDGTLYDLQPKVNLTPLEISPLGWHAAAPATIHAIGLHGADAAALPQVRLGIAISLDGFVNTAATGDPCATPATYLACLDSKGVNVVLQPDFNDGVSPCWSWTDFTEDCGTSQASWQPLSWMRSAWYDVQGRRANGAFAFTNFAYSVNTFQVGNLFDIGGDGQTAIFARNDARAVASWYAGDSNGALYAAAGADTDRADDARYALYEGPKPGFLALMPWKIAESTPASMVRRATPALTAGDPASLQSCEQGLAPGSSVTATQSPTCSENDYIDGVVAADLFPADVSPSVPDMPAPPLAAAAASMLVAAITIAVRRRPSGRTSNE